MKFFLTSPSTTTLHLHHGDIPAEWTATVQQQHKNKQNQDECLYHLIDGHVETFNLWKNMTCRNIYSRKLLKKILASQVVEPSMISFIQRDGNQHPYHLLPIPLLDLTMTTAFPKP
jgi:hypothetical protein